MSKGSTPRPCNREKFEKGWKRVFGETCPACGKRMKWRTGTQGDFEGFYCSSCREWEKAFGKSQIEMGNDGGFTSKSEWPPKMETYFGTITFTGEIPTQDD